MPDAARRETFPLIAPDLTESYEIIPGRSDAGLILICDHAVNDIPAAYGTLGLEPKELERHIAYDIGALAVTRGVAQALGVPAIFTKFSRLLIDVNRGLDDPTLIMRISDGAVVPGNRHLNEAEHAKRVSVYYEPYHLAIDRMIETCTAAGVPPVLLSIHSFTDSWKGVPRPWQAAILWDRDHRFAVPMLEALRAERDLLIGENEPYAVSDLTDYTVPVHGERRGLPHVEIEIRQDLIAEPAGQAIWAARLARLLPAAYEAFLRR